MKKILLSAVVLLFFAISLTLVQISCSKSNAQNTETQLDKIVFMRLASSGMQVWIANYDGTNSMQIPITMPPNTFITSDPATADVRLSPNGQTVFFIGENSSADKLIFSCNVNGSNVKQIFDGAGNWIKLGAAQ